MPAKKVVGLGSFQDKKDIHGKALCGGFGTHQNEEKALDFVIKSCLVVPEVLFLFSNDDGRLRCLRGTSNRFGGQQKKPERNRESQSWYTRLKM